MLDKLIISTSVVGGMGLVLGMGLSIASKMFEVKVDPRVAKVREVLPGANCGACGQTGCDAFAQCVVEGECEINGCTVGGQELADKLGEILGVKAQTVEEKVAKIMCGGTHEVCKSKFDYAGILDCAAAANLFGGPSACTYGCVGLGDCVRACPFDAIVIKDGLANIIESKCRACGKCVEACPKNIIEMVLKKGRYSVSCSSMDKGGIVRKNCEVGCIGCRKCSKVCPTDAISFAGTLAKIDTAVCINCGECAAVCPTGAIENKKNLKKCV
ncbi:MAG: RnfABCDGE type electron transport complex subunit B [Clostridium sp.]|nr:RnfABCDGE type electron transport complex subunit B [Clostridium sp.]